MLEFFGLLKCFKKIKIKIEIAQALQCYADK